MKASQHASQPFRPILCLVVAALGLTASAQAEPFDLVVADPAASHPGEPNRLKMATYYAADGTVWLMFPKVITDSDRQRSGYQQATVPVYVDHSHGNR